MTTDERDMRWVMCDCCCEVSPCTWQSRLPDGGWTFPVDDFGYYGGFGDNLEVELGGRPSRWLIMCHDCVVKMLTLFPLLGDRVFGSHPNYTHGGPTPEDGTLLPSCCRWGWTTNGETVYEGDGNGGWIERYTTKGA